MKKLKITKAASSDLSEESLRESLKGLGINLVAAGSGLCAEAPEGKWFLTNPAPKCIEWAGCVWIGRRSLSQFKAYVESLELKVAGSYEEANNIKD